MTAVNILTLLGSVARDYFKTVLADRKFAFLLLLLLLNGVVFGPFLPFLPVYVDEQLALNQSFTANFRSISLLLMATFVLLGGVISDTLGPKRAMLIGMLGTPVAAVVFMIGNPGVLLTLAVFRGISEGFLSGGGQTYMLASAPSGRLAVAAALYFLGNTLGSAIGSPIGGLILDTSSFFTLGLVMFVASGPVLLAMILMLPELPPQTAERPRVIDVLTMYFRIAGRRHVWTLAAMQFLRTVFWGATSLAIPLLLNDLTDSKRIVGWYQFVSLVAGMTSMIVVGAISDRKGRRRIVIVCIAGIGIASVLLSLSAGNAVSLFICGVLATTVAWTLSGQVTPLAKEMSNPGEEGRLVGMILFPWALGMLAGSQIHGLMSQSRPGLMFALLTLLIMAAYGLTELMFQSKSRPYS